MKTLFLTFLGLFLCLSFCFAQSDSTRYDENEVDTTSFYYQFGSDLDAITIRAKAELGISDTSNLKVSKIQGKYIISVENTHFQTMPNAWEGLKQIPLLKVSDGKTLEVQQKQVLVEINGVQLQLQGDEVENYLKSLDSKSIESIEINPNPDASYSTEISAIINIKLNQFLNNYKIGLTTTNGIRTNYYNSTTFNYAVNKKGFRSYLSYSFDYLPRFNTSKVAQGFENTASFSEFNYEENNKAITHQLFLNLNFDIGKKNNLDFTQSYSSQNSLIEGETKATNFHRNIELNTNSNFLQLAQTWKHTFNKKSNLKAGSYQVFKNSDAKNIALQESENNEMQNIETTIPILIRFLDYNYTGKYGTTSIGSRFNTIKVRNKNKTFQSGEEQETKIESPFNYNESVLAFYINQGIDVSETSYLSIGLRSESSFIDYNFSNSLANQSYSDTLRYTNLLFNASYSWQTKKETYFTLAFRNQIQRPNYNSLNPFQLISSDVIYFSGDTQVQPAKLYGLTLQASKGSWFFYTQAGMFDDFISSFFTESEERVIQTYKNFDRVWLAGAGIEYYKPLFDKKWILKTGLDFSYVKLDDTSYEIIEPATPIFTFNTTNVITLAKNYKLNLNYEITPTYKDGLLEHKTSQRLDINLTTKIHSKVSLLFFANDIFKTDIRWERTTVPNFFYESNQYNDIRSFGITLRWNFAGKNYEQRQLEDTDDTSIDRL